MTPNSQDLPTMPSVELPQIPDRQFDLREFGARDGGRVNNMSAFRDAISRCAQSGGGMVRVPAGLWLTGPIHLQSQIRLHLDEGAIIRFSTAPTDYLPVVLTRWEGNECYNYSPLIYARNCHDIAVTGSGTFEGQGDSWWHWKQLQHAATQLLYQAQKNNLAVEQRVFGREEDALRPQFFQPLGCQRVLIEGVRFVDGPMWTLHPVYCQDVTVRGVQVVTDPDGPNTDGLNPDSCRQVLIEDCFFSTGDDCIAVISGLNEDGWRVSRPSEDVLIRRCQMENGHGGVAIGSGTSGDVRNVTVQDCTFKGTDRGIRLKSMRGRGGIVENVHFENISMRDIIHEAITIDMYYGYSSAPSASNTPPIFRSIGIRNISCDGAATAIQLRGLPESPIQKLNLENIDLRADHGVTVECVDGLDLINVSVQTKTGSPA